MWPLSNYRRLHLLRVKLKQSFMFGFKLEGYSENFIVNAI